MPCIFHSSSQDQEQCKLIKNIQVYTNFNKKKNSTSTKPSIRQWTQNNTCTSLQVKHVYLRLCFLLCCSSFLELLHLVLDDLVPLQRERNRQLIIISSDNAASYTTRSCFVLQSNKTYHFLGLHHLEAIKVRHCGPLLK